MKLWIRAPCPAAPDQPVETSQVRSVLKYNFPGLSDANIFTDITKRDHKKAPRSDVYTAGFPCQEYSRQGKGRGLRSEKGTVGLHVVEYIRCKQPKVFLLENVQNLVNQHAKSFEILMNQLKEIKSKGGKQTYTLRYNVLNAIDYTLPQNRPRVIIVGIKASCEKKSRPFSWPAKQRTWP